MEKVGNSKTWWLISGDRQTNTVRETNNVEEIHCSQNSLRRWLYRGVKHVSWKQKIPGEQVLGRLKENSLWIRKTDNSDVFVTWRDMTHSGWSQGQICAGRRRCFGWDEGIIEWTGSSLTECTSKATDRDLWRSIYCRPSLWRGHLGAGLFIFGTVLPQSTSSFFRST